MKAVTSILFKIHSRAKCVQTPDDVAQWNEKQEI